MTVRSLGFRKKLALKVFQKMKQNASQIHTLNYLFWECTLRCNLACIHCGSDCTKNSKQADMPSADFFRALDQLKGTINAHKTMIVLTGGEALMRKDLPNIGKQLYQREFPWGIVTNGALLTQKKLESLLDSGLRAVTISLDGLEQGHNWLRGSSKSFEKAVKAIEILAKTEDLLFDVATCVHQNNVQQLEELKDLLVAKGVKKWRIFTIYPIGRAKDNEALQLSPVQFKALFDQIVRFREEGRIQVEYGCEGFLGSYEGKVRDQFFNCKAGVNIASILVDGSIAACPNLRGNFIQGNIYQDNLKEVWENRYQIFRDRSWTKKGICSDCEFHRYCQGNGMHLRDEQSGELSICHLQKIQEGERSKP
ncbi:TIGR04133 family radical SAM/SPASM protein [Persicobacter sp. CCB-QB2]|uniref:TIGR04133 family radical SAM/SPASM protein n=1 Tax=Persicobacter sp. CCB-QB2 TaxID=1561025 RepID=UPI0006A960AC|nr:TIGR04133 family radical SAM/SPASM protein [Persicobacter sp. CCB-QB2]